MNKVKCYDMVYFGLLQQNIYNSMRNSLCVTFKDQYQLGVVYICIVVN